MGITINGSSAAGNIDLGTNGTITDLAVGGLPDGTVDADTLAANAKYDDTKLKRDLNILALHSAIDNNKTAHSLSDTYIEQFEDSSKITLTTAKRDTDEFIDTVDVGITNISDGIAGGEGMDGDEDQGGATSYTGYDGVTRSKGQMTGGSFNTYEGFNLKHIFASNEDFEVIIAMRGNFQNVGYLQGSGISNLNQLEYVSNNPFWDDNVNACFSGYPGTYYAQYHAPVANDGSSDYRNLYRFSRVSNSFKIQYYGRSTSDITVNATTIAAVRNSTNYVDDIGSATTFSNPMVIGFGEAGTEGDSSTRYIKIEVANKGTATTSATGTCQGSAITASSSRTKVSGVILYKNNEGTNTLGTDLKIYFTCNGGTNWTEASSYTPGSDFSTGIKTAHLGETTCTAGTDIRWKAEWANQSKGSKEAQLHGIGVNY